MTKTVSGNGPYTSPSVHVSTVGVYHWVASYGGDANNKAVSGVCGDSNENVTVGKASPTILTNAAPITRTIVAGGLDLTDTATLSGGATPTGTITFHLYADNGSGGCGTELTGSPVTKAVSSGNGTYTSPPVHVSTVGVYHWVASYGGDVNNKTVSGACGDANEDVTVGKAGPAISTDASPLTVSLVSGGLDLTDTATLTGGANPTGTITFHLYADNGSGGCGSELAGSPVTKSVSGAGSYISPSVHVATAGVYHWVASYGGDANNGPAAGSCGDTNENVTVGKASPGIVTDASPLSQTIVSGGLDLTDTATLSSGQNPTGTITFHLFADNGSGGCGSELAGSPVTKTVSGNGPYTSPSVHVSTVGIYHWVASYSGDANNKTVSGSCGDANENVTVGKASPAISTDASPLTQTIVAGGLDLTDTATLSGGASPTGTITFHLYADNGSGGCGTELVGSPVTKAVSGNGPYISPSVHVAVAGTYHWVASYGGDVNNKSVSGVCGDLNENVTVAKAGPAISTDASPLTVSLVSGGLDLTDKATLSGGASPAGTITFHLYADNGTGGCGSELAGSPVTTTIAGNGTYTSPSVHVSTVGIYHWVASYAGDINNKSVTGRLWRHERERDGRQGEPGDLDECRPADAHDRGRRPRSDGYCDALGRPEPDRDDHLPPVRR